jgi:hypothetical protein
MIIASRSSVPTTQRYDLLIDTNLRPNHGKTGAFKVEF